MHEQEGGRGEVPPLPFSPIPSSISPSPLAKLGGDGGKRGRGIEGLHPLYE